MAKENILVVEDEEDILELVTYNLTKEGYTVTGLTAGDQAYPTAKNILPDLIVLDLMLPGMDGLDICKMIRKDSKTEHIPIIMLTAKSEESDIITGLELGADDYITKPFSPKVLIARIRSLFRRKSANKITQQETVQIHDMVINPGRYEVIVDGGPIDLTLTEFQILHILARRPGWVFTRDQLIDAIRGEDAYITDRSIDVQIVGLRKKLGHAGKYIQTVRGIGYKFKE